MDALPSEIVLHITTFLDPTSIVTLQLVSRHFLTIARDNNLWRNQCFIKVQIRDAQLQEQRRRQLERNSLSASVAASELLPADKARRLANWDPTFATEKVDWYEEFIHRHAPIAISWLQQPRCSSGHGDVDRGEYLEVRGLGVYAPPDDRDGGLAVAPLDDGSVCLWSVNDGARARKGAIVGRSSTQVLLSDGTSRVRSKMVGTGVVECVAVDEWRKRAYIAVQSDLIEVDLETLQAVSNEKFPFSISALSEARGSTPITVGTNLSLHLHDHRQPTLRHLHMDMGQIDLNTSLSSDRATGFGCIFDPISRPNYAPLFRPGPLSILHLTTLGENWNDSSDIYVAGRFSSILNYDRRYFPKLRGTIYSGARLCSMTSIPHAFSARDKEQLRHSQFSIEEAEASRAVPGNTLIAAGEYNSKGSLELYNLSPGQHRTVPSPELYAKPAHDSVSKNRQTSSSSKLLSVINHGTRLVFSDGNGNFKWVGRDGFTEVRRWNIAHGSSEGPRGIFGTLGDYYMDSGTGDIARKILRANGNNRAQSINKDDLIFWTGEKIGLLNFSSKPGFTSDSFEETAKTLQEIHKEREERIYAQTMRRALERQADEVKFVQGLGLGLR